MVIVLLAMIIANSPWGDAYAAFWNKEVHLQIGEFNLFSHNGNHMTLMNFINDVFVWRDRKDMGAYLGEIPSVEISEEE